MGEDFEDFIQELLPEGWETDAETFGCDFLLICPHGNTIEQDCRAAPCGCVSPLIEMGLI